MLSKNSKFFLILSICLSASLSFAQDAEKGKALYQACIQCHGEQGLGDKAQEAPKLSGQFDWYIVSQLNKFKAKERHNPKMYPFIKNLTNKDFEDLAAYISKL